MLQRTLVARGGVEARQRQQLFAPFEIFPDAFLDDRTERVPNLRKRLGLFVAQAFEFANHPAGDGFSDLRKLRIVLQHFPGNIEREVFAVDDAADEAEIAGQQISIVGDKDATDIEFDVPFAGGLEQIERLCRGRKQQNRIGLPPFGAIVQRQRRLVEGAGDRTIGLLVVFRRQLRFRPLPQCARRIDLALLALFCLELDRKLDVVGIGADDPFDLVSFQIFFRVGF